MNQVAATGSYSGKCDINMINRYLVEQIAQDKTEKIVVEKKDNNNFEVQISRYQKFSGARDEV